MKVRLDVYTTCTHSSGHTTRSHARPPRPRELATGGPASNSRAFREEVRDRVGSSLFLDVGSRNGLGPKRMHLRSLLRERNPHEGLAVSRGDSEGRHGWVETWSLFDDTLRSTGTGRTRKQRAVTEGRETGLLLKIFLDSNGRGIGASLPRRIPVIGPAG